MKTIKGPAIFLAQYVGDEAPFNSWDAITKWAAELGYEGVQVPSWDSVYSISTWPPKVRITAMNFPAPRPSTASRFRSFRPICKANASP